MGLEDIQRTSELKTILRPYMTQSHLFIVYAHDGERALEQVTAAGLQPLTSLVRRSSLEDVFLRLTGRSLIE